MIVITIIIMMMIIRLISLLDAVRRIYVEEGFAAFYKGLLPSLFSAYHGFIQFATYEAISTELIRYTNDNRVVCTKERRGGEMRRRKGQYQLNS